jgi:hypothetical protein
LIVVRLPQAPPAPSAIVRSTPMALARAVTGPNRAVVCDKSAQQVTEQRHPGRVDRFG